MSETHEEGPTAETNDDGVVVGGGPADGEDASKNAPNPNPDAVGPDYPQVMPGESAPPPAVPADQEENVPDHNE